MEKKSYSSKTGRRLEPTILLLVFVMVSVAQTQTPDSCKAELSNADQKYKTNDFDAARDLLNRCVKNKKASKYGKVEAYKLLGKVYIAKDSTDKALEAFKAMLKLDCRTMLDSTQVTPEVFMTFQDAKKQQTCGSKKWLWIGGGLAAGGGAAIIILTGGGDGEPPIQDGFVQPPGRPPGK